MTVFFTSDLHFGHARIIELCQRPFTDVEHMDAELVRRWNSRIGPRDTVWMLGDIFMCALPRALSIMHSLQGKKLLIPGNHDGMILKNPELAAKFYKIYPDLYATGINGVHVVMCHYPLLSWNRSHRGSWMLHGHSHGQVRAAGHARRLDVGVDANEWFPVSWSELAATARSQVDTGSAI